MYRVTWDRKVYRELGSIDQKIASAIVKKTEKYLALDPQKLGEPLVGKFRKYWKYRVGDYRVIYRIDTMSNCIIISKVRHRSSVYKKMR